MKKNKKPSYGPVAWGSVTLGEMKTTHARDPFADRAAHHRMMAVLDLVAAARALQSEQTRRGIVFEDPANPALALDLLPGLLLSQVSHLAGLLLLRRQRQSCKPKPDRAARETQMAHIKGALVELAALAVAAAESMEGRKA